MYLDDELTTQGLFDGYVLMNGAAVFVDGHCVYEQPLPRARVREIVALSEAYGVEYILQGPRQVYLRPEFHGLEEFYRGIGIDVGRFVRSFSLEDIDVCKLEFLAFEAEGGGAFRQLLALPGLTGLMDPYHKKNMELYAADVSKGSGILRALEALAIPVRDSIAFGDGLNDIEMMTTVGTSLVMERVFSFPGVGTLLLNSVIGRDFPVVQGTVLVVAILIIVVNLVVDVCYGLINPKARPQ